MDVVYRLLGTEFEWDEEKTNHLGPPGDTSGKEAI